MRISVITPSMNRAKQLIECAETLPASTKSHQIEFVPVIDCDADSLSAMMKLGDKWKAEGTNRIVPIFNQQRKGAIACWNQGLVKSSGWYIVFGGDDLRFTPGSLDVAIKFLEETLGGFGLVGFNDGYQDGNTLSVHYIADIRFIKLILGGRIGFPMFLFYCNDNVPNLLAKQSGRFYWCRESVVNHCHYTRPGEMGREKDYMDRKNEGLVPEDIRRYEAWVARGARIEWESLI